MDFLSLLKKYIDHAAAQVGCSLITMEDGTWAMHDDNFLRDVELNVGIPDCHVKNFRQVAVCYVARCWAEGFDVQKKFLPGRLADAIDMYLKGFRGGINYSEDSTWKSNGCVTVPSPSEKVESND